MKYITSILLICLLGCDTSRGRWEWNDSIHTRHNAHLVCNGYGNFALYLDDGWYVGVRSNPEHYLLAHDDSAYIVNNGWTILSKEFCNEPYINEMWWWYTKFDTIPVGIDSLKEYGKIDDAQKLLMLWNKRVDEERTADSLHWLKSQYKQCK